jgi:SAM-dependent methyltransferase
VPDRHLPNERVVEVPWALSVLPQVGLVLDVGSCEATYLAAIQNRGRVLHCIDARECAEAMPEGAVFHQQNILENTLEAGAYDAVLFLSTLEHIGLPTYGQPLFGDGDRRALDAAARLLAPSGRLVVTVPAGRSRTATWFRQYAPKDLRDLFRNWSFEARYWGFDGASYVAIEESSVIRYEYRETFNDDSGAGAVAGIVARPIFARG